MAKIDEAISALQPYSDTIQSVFELVSIFVGGVFGLFVFSLVLRMIFVKTVLKYFKELKVSMDRMEAKIDNLKKKKK